MTIDCEFYDLKLALHAAAGLMVWYMSTHQWLLTDRPALLFT